VSTQHRLPHLIGNVEFPLQSPVKTQPVPTWDIDLLGNVSSDLDSVRVTIADITATPVDDDGLTFDPASVVTVRIAEDADYEGVRGKFQGLLGNSRIAMQIDIGFSDVIMPGLSKTRDPTLLDQPAADLHLDTLFATEAALVLPTSLRDSLNPPRTFTPTPPQLAAAAGRRGAG